VEGMGRVRLTRAGAAGPAAVALVLGGCADRSDAPQDVVDEWLRPTGAPSSSTPSDASGERTSPDGVYGQTARTSLLGQIPDEGNCDTGPVQ